MKNKKILNTVMTLSALALIGGGLMVVQAAENTSFEKKAGRGNGLGNAEMQAERETRRAEMDANREASEAAIAANDYNAWKEAIGDNHPFAEKITADNFAKFVEAHKLMEEARAIFTDLGIEQGPGMGMGRGHGMGQGFGNTAK